MRRAPGWLCVAALIGGLGVFGLKLRDNNLQPLDVGLDLDTGLALFAAGFAERRVRPTLRVGDVLVLAGFLWWMEDLLAVQGYLADTLAPLAAEAPTPLLAWIVLTYPGTRLTSRVQRGLLGLSAFTCWVVVPIDQAASASKPNQGLFSYDAGTAYNVLERVRGTLIDVASVALAIFLAVRLLRSRGVRRRVLLPVALPTVVATVAAALDVAFGAHGFIDHDVLGSYEYTSAIDQAAVGLVPLGFLAAAVRLEAVRVRVTGLLGGGQAGAASGADLARRLRTTLRDPDVEIVPAGSAAAPTRALLPLAVDPPLAVTLDDSYAAAAGVRHAIVAVAESLLEQERLRGEIQRQLVDVTMSRARLVETADAARRQVERDLHDGAQQELVAASIALRQAAEQAGDAPLILEAEARLHDALVALRTLARGVSPPLLAEQGLAVALRSLRDRCPIAVELHRLPVERLPAEVERAAYLVVAESLTNAVKHAGSDSAAVSVWGSVAGGMLHVQVSDTGSGGATVSAGGGLQGLADRVAAAGGTFELASPAGGGTTVDVCLPVAAAAERRAPGRRPQGGHP